MMLVTSFDARVDVRLSQIISGRPSDMSTPCLYSVHIDEPGAESLSNSVEIMRSTLHAAESRRNIDLQTCLRGKRIELSAV